jgi:hypothetical protein
MVDGQHQAKDAKGQGFGTLGDVFGSPDIRTLFGPKDARRAAKRAEVRASEQPAVEAPTPAASAEQTEAVSQSEQRAIYRRTFNAAEMFSRDETGVDVLRTLRASLEPIVADKVTAGRGLANKAEALIKTIDDKIQSLETVTTPAPGPAPEAPEQAASSELVSELRGMISAVDSRVKSGKADESDYFELDRARNGLSGLSKEDRKKLQKRLAEVWNAYDTRGGRRALEARQELLEDSIVGLINELVNDARIWKEAAGPEVDEAMYRKRKGLMIDYVYEPDQARAALETEIADNEAFKPGIDDLEFLIGRFEHGLKTLKRLDKNAQDKKQRTEKAHEVE